MRNLAHETDSKAPGSSFSSSLASQRPKASSGSFLYLALNCQSLDFVSRTFDLILWPQRPRLWLPVFSWSFHYQRCHCQNHQCHLCHLCGAASQLLLSLTAQVFSLKHDSFPWFFWCLPHPANLQLPKRQIHWRRGMAILKRTEIMNPGESWWWWWYAKRKEHTWGICKNKSCWCCICSDNSTCSSIWGNSRSSFRFGMRLRSMHQRLQVKRLGHQVLRFIFNSLYLQIIHMSKTKMAW